MFNEVRAASHVKVLESNLYAIPYTHEVELKGHEGHVSAVALGKIW